MSKNPRTASKLTNEKNSCFVTNNELSEPKEDMENQVLINTRTPTPKKTQYRTSWKIYRISSSMNFRM